MDSIKIAKLHLVNMIPKAHLLGDEDVQQRGPGLYNASDTMVVAEVEGGHFNTVSMIV